MTVQSPASPTASLLAEHETEISERWARLLLERGGANYGRLSVREITWWTTRKLRAVIGYLRAADPEPPSIWWTPDYVFAGILISFTVLLPPRG